MRIVTVVGVGSQFIKAAVVFHELRKRHGDSHSARKIVDLLKMKQKEKEGLL